MSVESLKEQLKIVSIELEEIIFSPELEKFRGKIDKISIGISMDLEKNFERDPVSHKRYESLAVYIKFILKDDVSKEFLASITATTQYEIRILKLSEVTPEFYLHLHTIAVEHCAGWFAYRAAGTALENYNLQHIGPEQFGNKVQEYIINIWG
jgi:hypothetical protein